MKKLRLTLLVLVWLATMMVAPLTHPASAAPLLEPLAQGVGPSQPVVHTVMFWMNGCGHCEKVMREVLPPLQTQYGAQLDILLIEVKNQADVEFLYQVSESYGVAREATGVPFIIVGDRVLVGDKPIQDGLPGLIEEFLASGGVGYPDNPLLAPYLPTPTPTPDAAAMVQCEPATPCETPAAGDAAPTVDQHPQEEESTTLGLTLAAIIAVFMVASLVMTVIIFILAYQGKPIGTKAAWLDWAIPVLCIIGLIVAGYLTSIEYSGKTPYCGPVEGCDKVQSSKYAWVIKDILPVGLFGMMGYIGILAAWLWGHFRRDWIAKNVPLALFGMTLFGTVYSLYLTYLELFVIKAACIWCLANAVIVAVLLLLSLPPASKMIAVVDDDEEEDLQEERE